MEHLKDITNEELIDIYRLAMEHKDMLEAEKNKLTEENSE